MITRHKPCSHRCNPVNMSSRCTEAHSILSSCWIIVWVDDTRSSSSVWLKPQYPPSSYSSSIIKPQTEPRSAHHQCLQAIWCEFGSVTVFTLSMMAAVDVLLVFVKSSITVSSHCIVIWSNLQKWFPSSVFLAVSKDRNCFKIRFICMKAYFHHIKKCFGKL